MCSYSPQLEELKDAKSEHEMLREPVEPLHVSLRRNWVVMIVVFLCAFIVFTWRLRPGAPQHLASATIVVVQGASSTDISALSQIGNDAAQSIAFKNVNTHIALLTATGTLTRATAKLPQAVRERLQIRSNSLAGMVTARSPDEQSLVEVAVRAGDPSAATEVLRLVIRAYAERLTELARAGHQKSQQQIQQQIQEVRNSIGETLTSVSRGSAAVTSEKGPAEEREKVHALRGLEAALKTRAVALEAVKPSITNYMPTVLDITAVPDPTARTWSRALLTSAICAFLLSLISAVWMEQMRGR